jgi:hypothetical protein
MAQVISKIVIDENGKPQWVTYETELEYVNAITQ